METTKTQNVAILWCHQERTPLQEWTLTKTRWTSYTKTLIHKITIWWDNQLPPVLPPILSPPIHFAEYLPAWNFSRLLPPRRREPDYNNVAVHRLQGHGTAHMLNAIKWLPHCNTQNHFTGFMFPKLHFQVFLILKHSSLILSPRWSNPHEMASHFKEKEQELQSYIIWNVKVTLCIDEELHHGWEVLQYRNVCRWCILLWQKDPVIRKSLAHGTEKTILCPACLILCQLPAWTGGRLGILPHKHRPQSSTGPCRAA